jgi:hypothetical protein
MFSWQLIIVALAILAAAAYVAREIWRIVAARPGCGSCGSCESNKDAAPGKALVSLDERPVQAPRK